jgi:adenosylmethionine---8-amino-7-oxononanoate aminotransferase
MRRPEFLQQVQQVARQWGLLVIYDEVMTGFGRTGDWFACATAQTAPDIICLSKGITGGFLPFAATVCSEAIYSAFLSSDASHTLYHGHSYAANPLGCAAALASLELMRQNEAAFKGLEARHWQQLARLQGHPQLERLRVTGTIAAMDVVTDGARDYLNPIGMQIRTAALFQNLLLRPLGNVLYVMPPYCITDAELDQVYQGIERVLAAL